jgi:hypothetical protein
VKSEAKARRMAKSTGWKQDKEEDREKEDSEEGVCNRLWADTGKGRGTRRENRTEVDDEGVGNMR